jgi:hypothetical protein
MLLSSGGEEWYGHVEKRAELTENLASGLG